MLITEITDDKNFREPLVDQLCKLFEEGKRKPIESKPLRAHTYLSGAEYRSADYIAEC